MGTEEDTKLELFLQWLQVNKVELRGCQIKYCGPDKGFGIFSSIDASDNSIPLVVPLDLAITPMRVLQDPLIGPECRAMFEEGEVDDRFLIMLFLMVERLRKNSSWKPYFDLLPTSFGNPLWFSDDELLELKGTILHRATELQKAKLASLFNDKVKDLVKKLLILDGHSTCEVAFEDFLWANSVFWTRALNIPLPRSYVFPQAQEDENNQISINKLEICCDNNSSAVLSSKKEESGFEDQVDNGGNTISSGSIQGETVWVEGLVPGIDFCNHGVKATATWEVDANGSQTGVPSSMYLLSAEQCPLQAEREIFISYGNKGNEELLYLYGFAVDNNPDDFLMVHYPFEAINSVPFSDSKLQLLESQKAEMQCLLPKNLLEHGFFPEGLSKTDGIDRNKLNQVCNYSWSGQRKIPSYVNKLVFPPDFLSALRTIAMREDELFSAASLLEELVGPERERLPTENEVKTAIWEAAGDSGALQLLVDLLQTKMMDLEEGSRTEDHDSELLEKLALTETMEQQKSGGLKKVDANSRNKRNSIIYRKGQKQLTRLFLREAEHALQLSLREGN